jgi:hypothetical protein
MTIHTNRQTRDLTSGHESQQGLDTKMDWLTDRQSQSDLDLDLIPRARLTHPADDVGSKDL